MQVTCTILLTNILCSCDGNRLGGRGGAVKEGRGVRRFLNKRLIPGKVHLVEWFD